MISIIVPNYNHRKFLPQRLETVFNQTFQDFEVILLDDRSTDDSWEYLKQFENHLKVSHCIRNEFNSGSPFRQWKKGLDLAKYDWIWIAESDDFSELDFLESIFASLNSQEIDNVNLAYSQSEDVDINGNLITSRLDWTKEFVPNIWESDFILDGKIFIKNYLVYKNVIPNASSVVFRKPNWGFDKWQFLESFSLCGDWMFWIWIICDSNVLFISRHLNYFRFHESTSRVYNSVVKKRLRLFEEFLILLSLKEINFDFSFRLKKIQYSWFDLFDTFDFLFTSSLYRINIFNSKIVLLKHFIRYKFG